jgi:hypothetical protein
MNPYYDPAEVGLTMLTFEEPNLSYEFNMIGFWTDAQGRLYTAQCSGCSCPAPFEDYCGDTPSEVLGKLQRIGSIDEAISVLNYWNRRTEYDYDPNAKSSIVSASTMLVDAEQELRRWLAEYARVNPPSRAYSPRSFQVAPVPDEVPGIPSISNEEEV